MSYSIGSVTFSKANHIWLHDTKGWPDHYDYSTLSAWRGGKAYIGDHRSKEVIVQWTGIADTRAALVTLAAYDVNNYDWNEDASDLYLSDGTQQWKIYGLGLAYRPMVDASQANVFAFTLNLILSSIASKGLTKHTKTGTATSSPTTVTGFANSGSKDAAFDLVKFGGIYSGGNLTSPQIAHGTTGAVLQIADVLLDGADFSFLEDYIAHHSSVDPLSNTNRWGYNKSASSGVTFSVDHLVFANTSYLKFRYRLLHPLIQDPVLTLSVSNLVGTPVLEVSTDDVNYYLVANIVAGALIDYTLPKLIGYDEFYWRITCNASDSMDLDYYGLDSWHSYSGQTPVPVISDGATNESIVITKAAGGNATYDFEWYDNSMI